MRLVHLVEVVEEVTVWSDHQQCQVLTSLPVSLEGTLCSRADLTRYGALTKLYKFAGVREHLILEVDLKQISKVCFFSTCMREEVGQPALKWLLGLE